MHLNEKMAANKFLILAEMPTPKGVDCEAMLSCAGSIKGRVDAFVVPEMSNAVMKMSALGGAILLQSKGHETVMQVCCRDRNRLALQADLLAASALGIGNLMAVTGEDPSYGDHHQARAACDIDLPELLKAIQALQRGRDMAGVELAGTPKFTVGSAVNAGLTGAALTAELAALDQRLSEGVEFFITTPIFDLHAFAEFLALAPRKARIIPTVLLLKSVGMARYIDRNLDYVHIPEPLILRLQKAPEKVRESVQMAAELISGLKEMGCGGVMLSTLGWEDKLRDILDRVKV